MFVIRYVQFLVTAIVFGFHWIVLQLTSVTQRSISQNESVSRSITTDNEADEGPSVMIASPAVALLLYAISVFVTGSIVSRGIAAHRKDLPRALFYKNAGDFISREEAFFFAMGVGIAVTEFYRAQEKDPPEVLVFALTTIPLELSLNLFAGLYNLCAQRNRRPHFFSLLKNILLQTTLPSAATALLTYRFSFDILYKRDSLANKWLWVALAGVFAHVPREVAALLFTKIVDVLSSYYKPNSVIEIADEDLPHISESADDEGFRTDAEMSETETEESPLSVSTDEPRRSDPIAGSIILWLLPVPIMAAALWCAAAKACELTDQSLRKDKFSELALPLLLSSMGATMGVAIVNLIWGLAVRTEDLWSRPLNKKKEEKADRVIPAYSPYRARDFQEGEEPAHHRYYTRPNSPITLTDREKRLEFQNRLCERKREDGISMMTNPHGLNYYEEARNDLEIAAKLGDALAWCLLGLLYEYGLGVRPSLNAASFCYDQANVNIDKSHALIKLVHSVGYFRQLKKEAIIYFEYAINMLLESIELSKQCKLEDWKDTINLLDRIANTPNDVSANLILALVYELGLLGVVSNPSRVSYYYKRVAECGESWTQYNLGMAYQNKRWPDQRSPDKNAAEAYHWLHLSVQPNHTVVESLHLYNLGVLYRDGVGVAKNYNEAIICFQHACDLGSGVAYDALANMYEKGWGCDIDLNEAARLKDEGNRKRRSGQVHFLLTLKEDLPYKRHSRKINFNSINGHKDMVPVEVSRTFYDRKRVDLLRIKKGEVIHVKVIEGENWLDGINSSGCRGKVPVNCIRLLKKKNPVQAETAMKLSGKNIDEVDEGEIGNMQKFYEGIDTRVSLGFWKGVRVVIKELREHAMLDNEKIEAFETEYKLMAELNNPYIVKLLAITNTKKLIIEYMSHGSLWDFLEKNGPELLREKRLDIALHIAQAVHYLHKQRILHRDIKSYNVVLGPYFEELYVARLADFGEAIQCDDSMIASSSIQIGTVDWLSPELCGATIYVYTPKSDVYAYGVFLFELFTLRAASLVKDDLLNKQEPSVPEIPSEIERLIRGCCAESIQERFNISDVVKKLSSQIQHSSSSNAEGKEEEEEEEEEEERSSPSVGFSWGMSSKLPLFQHPKLENEAQKKTHERRHSFG